MSPEQEGLGSRQIISRIVLVCMWLSLPISLVMNMPEKVIVTIIIFIGFFLFSHSCLAYIYNDLVVNKKNWQAYLLIVLFGPVEIDRLKKISRQKSLDAVTD